MPHIPDPTSPFHALPEPEFIEKPRAFNGTPAQMLSSRNSRKSSSILRADFTRWEGYECTPEVPLSCPIVVFGDVDDSEVGLNDLEAWREHASTSFELAIYPGFFLHSSKLVLLQRLGIELSRWVESLMDRAKRTATLEVS